MIPIISESFCPSEIEKIEPFGRLDTASIHSVVLTIVENMVVSLLKISEHCTGIVMFLVQLAFGFALHRMRI
jgi:hypothetical protein